MAGQSLQEALICEKWPLTAREAYTAGLGDMRYCMTLAAAECRRDTTLEEGQVLAQFIQELWAHRIAKGQLPDVLEGLR